MGAAVSSVAAAALVCLSVPVAQAQVHLALLVSQGAALAMPRVLLEEGSRNRWKVLCQLVLVL